MTRIWLRENKLQGLFRRERMRVYKTVTISKLLFKKKKTKVARAHGAKHQKHTTSKKEVIIQCAH